MKVKKIERGWPGHFCLGYRCLFHRNTLLEFNNKHIVVSTVGLLLKRDHEELTGVNRFDEIGINRHFETMAFWADLQGGFWDANLDQVNFDSNWALEKPEDEIRADAMHEAVVSEISEKLIKGELSNGNLS